ncbi:hypothetical protein NM208_g1089 [Fusarium decemcellulare]|uniref:Uncharacterized protein n=1 Tax=Fusarium decemcellulare TaxID=57161 RepID=A0ACC1SX27_9HYPO|nr:hypothetical protein NM208_g1089 [Fusarium decemcellulare]
MSKKSELECQMVPHDDSSLTKSAILDVRYGSAPREHIWDADWAPAFERCDEEHGCFGYPDDLPTRLLDLESLPIVKLVEPKAGNGNTALSPDQIRNYRYAALSYCWGLSPAFTTTSVTIKERKEGFSIDRPEVPRTIAEAARVAHSSGLRYLWIDALCIIQGRDDVAGADWKRESERMRLVYGGAYVTIVAAGTSDASGGLVLGKPTCVLTSPGKDIVALTLKISDPDSDAPFWKEAIFSRAWTCQEWYLSSRLLVFTSTAAYFRCQKAGLPSSLTKHGSFNSVLPSSRRQFSTKPWSMFVANFAARNITNPTDKLPAIAGLARKFHEVGGDSLGKYCAGMWEKEIVNTLLWRREESTDISSFHLPMAFRRGRSLIKPDGATDDRKTWKPRAPSWSWAAVDGQIMIRKPSSTSIAARNISCWVKLADSASPYGHVDYGVLTLTCRYTMGKLLVKGPDLLVEINGSVSGYWGDDPLETFDLLRDPDPLLHLLCIEDREGIWSGIAVVPSPIVADHYVRVGQYMFAGVGACHRDIITSITEEPIVDESGIGSESTPPWADSILGQKYLAELTAESSLVTKHRHFENSSTMLEVKCSGTPYEIGHQHGSKAREKVAGSLVFYRGLFQSTCSMDWNAVHQEATKYVAPLQKLYPRYVEEMRGIADGAGVELLDIVALNVRTEITFSLFTDNPTASVKTDGCTSLACRTETGSMFLAQNWDWQVEQAPNLFVCHISQPNTGLPNISMVTEGGVIGKIGLNSSGVGVCLNAIKARGVDTSKLPIHLALRAALESHSALKAARRLEAIGTAGSGHILVSDEAGAIGLECTSIGIKGIGQGRDGTIVHANHLILEHPIVEEFPWLSDSSRRMKRLSTLLKEKTSSEAISESLLFELFKDEEGFPGAINRCQVDGCETQTLFNIIMDLAERKATVKVGRPTNFSERIELRP